MLIPFGSVTTYGDVAEKAGLPGYARQVGQTLRNLTEGSTIPWHRVINSQGRISFPEGSPKFIEQTQRLEKEGISVQFGKVCLGIYRW